MRYLETLAPWALYAMALLFGVAFLGCLLLQYLTGVKAGTLGTLREILEKGSPDQAIQYMVRSHGARSVTKEAVIRLLAVADRPYKILYTYEGALEGLGYLKTRTRSTRGYVLGLCTDVLSIASILSVGWLLYTIQPTGAAKVTLVALGGLVIGTQMAMQKLVGRVRALEGLLIQVRCVLYHRAGYLPPEHRPQKLEGAQLEAWGRAIQEIEASVLAGTHPEDATDEAIQKITKMYDASRAPEERRPPLSKADLLRTSE